MPVVTHSTSQGGCRAASLANLNPGGAAASGGATGGGGASGLGDSGRCRVAVSAPNDRSTSSVSAPAGALETRRPDGPATASRAIAFQRAGGALAGGAGAGARNLKLKPGGAWRGPRPGPPGRDVDAARAVS